MSAFVPSQALLRPLAAVDRDLLFHWRNKPFIVERSLSRRSVTLMEHQRWFDTLLQRRDVLAWIVEDRGLPVGHVRADESADHWLLTIYLVEQATGHGLGGRAIVQACIACAVLNPNIPVVAEIIPGNDAALRAFTRAGFQRDPALDNGDAVAMTWSASSEEAQTLAQYEGLLVEHGDSFRALNWGSEAGQQRRFEVLANIGEFAGARVLDVGCGLAHFADWLDRHGRGVHYTGLDMAPGLLAAAAARRPELRLVAGSILDQRMLIDEHFDYVFASGIFYTYREGAAAVLERSVRRMWEFALQGVAFNALGTYASDQVPGEYYADPDQVLRFCRTLSPSAQLITGYHPRDFTVYLYRETP